VIVGAFYAGLGLRPLFSIDSTIGVPRLGGATIPAFLAGFAVVGGMCALLYADAKNKPKYLWLVALNGFILILTAARMATLVAIITWGAIFLFGFKQKGRLKFYLAVAGIVAIPVFLALFGEQLLTRALSHDEKSRDVMRYYLEHYAEAFPDFGIGLGHQYTIISRDLIVKIGAVAAHNEYLKYLVELGWIGGLMFAAGWAWLFLATWWSPLNTRRTVYLLCIFAFLIYSATDNTLVRNELSFLIVVAAYGTRLALADRAPLRTIPHPVPAYPSAPRRGSRPQFAGGPAGGPANQS
jgi:O-antigen ligase